MREDGMDRRRVLELIAGGATVSTGAVLGITQIDNGKSNEGSTTAKPSTGTTSRVTPSGPPERVDIRDFGAEADGETDDTTAILDAIDAVAPGGTIVIPEGIVRISPRNNGYDPTETKAALPIERPDDGLSIVGAGQNVSDSQLVMDDGHTDNHIGLGIRADVTGTTGSEYSGLTIRGLTLDGRWWGQLADDTGDFPNGFATNIRGEFRSVTFENCRVQQWATTGGLMAAPGIRIRNCEFVRNGYGIAQDGKNGHGFNVRTDGREGRVVADECLFLNNVGDGIDARTGKVTINRCVFKGNGWGVKLKPTTEEVLMKHCKMVDTEKIHIRCVPTGDAGTGRLRLHSVEFDNSPWPAIHLDRRPGTLEGDNILVKNANTMGKKAGAVFIGADSPQGDRKVDIGTLSVHDVEGSAVDFRHAQGTIEVLKFSGADGVGLTDDVSIGTALEGDPIRIETPSKSEIGIISDSS
jgi:hypothetical protein